MGDYNELYNKMKKWVYSAPEEELKEHYKWYGVFKGDKEDLLNIMWESYCDAYYYDELVERINDLVEEVQ